MSATHRAWTRTGLCQKPDEANGVGRGKSTRKRAREKREGIRGSEKKNLGVCQRILARMRRWLHLQFQFPGRHSGLASPASLALAHPNYSHSPHKARYLVDHISSPFCTPHALLCPSHNVQGPGQANSSYSYAISTIPSQLAQI